MYSAKGLFDVVRKLVLLYIDNPVADPLALSVLELSLSTRPPFIASLKLVKDNSGLVLEFGKEALS
jgi:hypothetical protein